MNSYDAFRNAFYSTLQEKSVDFPEVDRVIFHDPATIVYWKDGTKTVVKRCSTEFMFDAEKGVMAAILKRVFGNDCSFHKVIKSCFENSDWYVK